MRLSPVRFLQGTRWVLAQDMPFGPMGDVRAAGEMLLPPIPLYRALLRAHRRLPVEMRSLGDDYVKSEFRRHRQVDNPLHIVGFCSQWKLYLDNLLVDNATGSVRGQRLDPNLLERFSDEQLYQLYELKLAAEEVFDPERAQSRPPETGSGSGSDNDSGSGSSSAV